MRIDFLKEKPFYLKDDDIEWVESCFKTMTTDDKIRQLFCLVTYSDDENLLINLAKNFKAGGIMCRPMKKEQLAKTVQILQSNAKIPMLIASNLEAGGNGLCSEGTKIGSPMQIAATNDIKYAEALGDVCGAEAAAIGCNWAFAPVIDIDYNFRNPITNIRTFGSDPETVRSFGLEYVKAVQKHGVAASIKHFPGDGRDERDQHLVTSINDFSAEEWDNTYGKIYKSCIDAGALTVMVGHIMQPAYSKKLNPQLKDEDILPATLSYELTTTLLKEKLGFSGLVVSDASTMAGMVIPMDRKRAVPLCIAAGCDMFLFTKNLEEDLQYMSDGVKDGIITIDRLDEAVIKILALKAALKLHKKDLFPKPENYNAILGCGKHKKIAGECADAAITLVKNKQDLLPLNPKTHKRILFHAIDSSDISMFTGEVNRINEVLLNKLKERGFEVTKFFPAKNLEGMICPYEEKIKNYDVLIYSAALNTKSNQTTVRIEWEQPMGANVPVYINTIPSVFISLENPYHLLDVPRIKTFINTYGSSEIILDMLLDKLTGKSEFKGKSPIDVFCGKWDTRL